MKMSALFLRAVTHLRQAESNTKEKFNLPINYPENTYLLFRNDPRLYPYGSASIVFQCSELILSCIYLVLTHSRRSSGCIIYHHVPWTV